MRNLELLDGSVCFVGGIDGFIEVLENKLGYDSRVYMENIRNRLDELENSDIVKELEEELYQTDLKYRKLYKDGGLREIELENKRLKAKNEKYLNIIKQLKSEVYNIQSRNGDDCVIKKHDDIIPF